MREFTAKFVAHVPGLRDGELRPLEAGPGVRYLLRDGVVSALTGPTRPARGHVHEKRVPGNLGLVDSAAPYAAATVLTASTTTSGARSGTK